MSTIIRNRIRTTFLLVLATLGLLALLFISPGTADAGFIVQRPLYIGLTDGLVGHWSFDGPDLAGTTAYDRSGNANNGTLTLGPTRALGKIGQALSFDGVDDYVDTNSSTIIDASLNFSISFWVNLSATVDYGGLVVKSPVFDGAVAKYFVSMFGTTQRIDFGVNGSEVQTVGTIPLNQWAHVAVTSDATGRAIYINGVKESFAAATTPASSVDTWKIGRWTPTDPNGVFNGQIDDVRIYNRMLSAAEVKRLYNIGSALNVATSQNAKLTSGLVGHWSFDGPDLAGTTAYDRSGNANNGTITNGPKPAIGKIGQGLSFDGVNDYVTAGNVGGGIKTIAFWIKASDVTSKKLINIDGTDQIETNGSDQVVATSFPAATVYINGIVASAVTDGQWHHVVVTDTTGVAGTTFEIGRVLTTYFPGLIEDVRIYNKVLSAQEIKRLYNIGGTTKVNTTRKDTLQDGLVGHWSFDGADLAGVTAYDRSGNANNGTLTGGPTPAIGKIGQALSFDGVNDFVSIADNASLRPGNDSWSVSVWANPPNKNQVVGLVTKNQAASPFPQWVISICGDDVCNTAGKKLVSDFIQADDSTHRKSISTADVADGNWHMYTMVADKSADRIFLYLDGQVLAVTTNNVGSWPSITNTDNVIIGDYTGGGGSFGGTIDDVRVYNRALSAQEVTRLYNMGR